MSSVETIACDVLVIGAGAIGLAAARELSERFSVVLVERHAKFGQETSSRNSEVIHSGIYYPIHSIKTEDCILGRDLLYQFCKEYHIGFNPCGKWLVASKPEEESYLEKLAAHCRALDVPCERVAQEDFAREPAVKVRAAVNFPKSGIVDSHGFLATLERHIEQRSGLLAYRHRVESLERKTSYWEVEVQGPEQKMTIQAPVVVNAAGLWAAELSNRALHVNRYEHRFCRGRYFSLPGSYRNLFHRLIYPVPPKDCVGVHVTIDLEGNARLGPDAEWCDVPLNRVESLYECDWESIRNQFGDLTRLFCPRVKDDELTPGLIGIRAKLFLEGAEHTDFLIENHDGFIHCLGIESPGLTASLAIAKRVERLAKEVL